MAGSHPRFEMPEGTESAATSSEAPRHRPAPEVAAAIVQIVVEHPELADVGQYLPFVEPSD